MSINRRMDKDVTRIYSGLLFHWTVWHIYMCMLVALVVSNSVILLCVACQALLSTGFSRQEYGNGSPCPPPGDLPDQGSDPQLSHLLHWQADSRRQSHLGSQSISFFISLPASEKSCTCLIRKKKKSFLAILICISLSMRELEHLSTCLLSFEFAIFMNFFYPLHTFLLSCFVKYSFISVLSKLRKRVLWICFPCFETAFHLNFSFCHYFPFIFHSKVTLLPRELD